MDYGRLSTDEQQPRNHFVQPERHFNQGGHIQPRQQMQNQAVPANQIVPVKRAPGREGFGQPIQPLQLSREHVHCIQEH